MSGEIMQMLQAILSTAARTAIPERAVYEAVCPTKNGGKQLKAFNMADGTRSQANIAKLLKINQGNFSRTVSRWVDAGVMFRIGVGRDAKLLHVYALPLQRPKEENA
jgi:hypothetical protein